MTRDEIIQLAKQAELWDYNLVRMNDDLLSACGHPTLWPELERFAALVAASEREECAKVCNNIADLARSTGEATFADQCAAAIRARSTDSATARKS